MITPVQHLEQPMSRNLGEGTGFGSWLSSLVGCGSIGGCGGGTSSAVIEGQVAAQVINAIAASGKSVKDPAAIATATHAIMAANQGSYTYATQNPALALSYVNQIIQKLQVAGQILDPVTQTPTTTSAGLLPATGLTLSPNNIFLYGGLALAGLLMVMSMRR